MVSRLRMLVFVALALAVVGSAWAQRFQRFRGYPQSPPPQSEPGDVPSAEFQFARMIYTDLPQQRRGGYGWWMQDWPDAEEHFGQGVGRLTRLDVGEGVTLLLTDDHVFDYPWLYATQVGYWDLSDEEVARLREYLLRGGFLMTDDFFGANEWYVFANTMSRVFPDRPLLEIPQDDPVLHVIYDIDEFTQIPGLRHLNCFGRGRRGGGGYAATRLPAPEWHGIYDDSGRLMVAVNYNQDVGDAWEEADDPCYPEPMTALAYRVAINYAIYTMTH
jgi:hypothetical protein